MALIAGCGGTTEDSREKPPAADDETASPGADVPGPRPASEDESIDDSAEPVPAPAVASVPEPAQPVEPEVLLEPAAEPDVLAEGEERPCERQLEFGSLTLSEPPPFDVVIVADHSDSLSWSQEDLARGLADLLSDVSGSDARFYVLTPTQYGADSAAVPQFSSTDFVPWRDPVTGDPYQNAMTHYSASCSDRDGTPIECPEYDPLLDLEYTLEGRFEFRMPAPVAAIQPDMSAEEVAAQQQLIADEILALSGGASYEQPLCTLARYVSQDAAELPENVVFVLISDEDDNTLPNECLQGFVHERRRSDSYTTGCGDECDLNRFAVQATGVRESVSFTCIPTDDLGNAHPELAVDRSFTRGAVTESCGPPECDESDLSSARNQCEPGDLIQNCERHCRTEAGSTCSVDIEDTSIDACSESFELNGSTYANVADYCSQTRDLSSWTGCGMTGYAVSEGTGNWTGGTSLRMVAFGLETSDLSSYFLRTADELFGENYVVEAIVHAPEFSCELGSGQSHGTNLASIATPGDVFPICESYAPALSRVRGFARELLQTEYEFELSNRETIEAVVITDQSGTERELSASDYAYDRDSARFTLNPAALRSSDRSLSVEIAVHCQPVAR